jgi:hypothetical protein
MAKYSYGQTPASKNVITYPVEFPVGMFRAIEEAARFEGVRILDYIKAVVHADLDSHFENEREARKQAKEEALLKKISKSKNITIIKKDEL